MRNYRSTFQIFASQWVCAEVLPIQTVLQLQERNLKSWSGSWGMRQPPHNEVTFFPEIVQIGPRTHPSFSWIDQRLISYKRIFSALSIALYQGHMAMREISSGHFLNLVELNLFALFSLLCLQYGQSETQRCCCSIAWSIWCVFVCLLWTSAESVHHRLR